MTPVFQQHPEMTLNLQEFAFIFRSTQKILRNYINEQSQNNMIQTISRSWFNAIHDGAVLSCKDYVVFRIYYTKGNSFVAATIKRNPKPNPHQFIVLAASEDELNELKNAMISNHIAIDVDEFALSSDWNNSPANKAVTNVSKNQGTDKLYDYAFIWTGSESTVWQELAKLAQHEVWGFGKDDWSILESYITQVFRKLVSENKVCESPSGSLAAFNTGLMTDSYEDIYMCFTPNNKKDKQPWKYYGFCTSSHGALGKRLFSEISPLPEFAEFITDVRDVVFSLGTNNQLKIDWEHILIDNIDRLPREFISRYLNDSPEMTNLLEEISYNPDLMNSPDPYGSHATGEDGARYDTLRSFLRDNREHFNRLSDAAQGAANRAINRAKRSFRTGVPMYYPNGNEMQMLLPLCLNKENVPDVALNISRTKAGDYQGNTILTLRMAYKNARLLCRPESEWLKP